MTTFVALGDSITLGVGDPIRLEPPPGRRKGERSWRGWAALLAETLPDPALHIVASNGACMADLERDQLPTALQLRPDIASVVIGVNDTLRANFDADRIAAATAHVVGALRATGADVLTMRLPDPGRMLGLPDVLARPLAAGRTGSTTSWTRSPRDSARCISTRLATLASATRRCGRWTGCTRASADTGTSRGGSTRCWPTPATC